MLRSLDTKLHNLFEISLISRQKTGNVAGFISIKFVDSKIIRTFAPSSSTKLLKELQGRLNSQATFVYENPPSLSTMLKSAGHYLFISIISKVVFFLTKLIYSICGLNLFTYSKTCLYSAESIKFWHFPQSISYILTINKKVILLKITFYRRKV